MSTSKPYELSLWQKRQATLLYHFASLDYLKGLKPRIDALINGTDLLLDQAKEEGRDALVVSKRWGARDTSANWSTYGFPALIEFQETTAWDIAQRTFESYGITGANQCGRLLGELSMGWATQDEEDTFKERFETVYRYAGNIDLVMRRPPTGDDYTFWLIWNDVKGQFPRLPRFRVRTDVEGETEKIPPRTGVYVPQDDPYGALQFRWTGGGYGELCDTYTFNELGLAALEAVGRDGLWSDDAGLLAFALQPQYRDVIKNVSGEAIDPADPFDQEFAASYVADSAFTRRPCKWYFVEMVNGEFEDSADEEDLDTARTIQRVTAGQACPVAGWWHSPARPGSRRRFRQGEVFPAIEGNDYGATFWLWDTDQG